MSTKTKNIKKIVVASLFAFVVLFSSKAQAIEYGMLGGKPANPDPGIENNSSWFIYNLKAGESKQDAITVMNLFESPLDMTLYPADSTNSSNGGYALKQMTEPKEEVGSWVRFYAANPPDDFVGIFQQYSGNIVEFCALDEAQLQKEYGKNILTSDQLAAFTQWCQGTNLVEKQFKAKETINISFVISIPANTDVGEHTGGILIQKKLPDDQAGPNVGSTVKLTTRVGVRIYETVPGDIIKKMSLDDFKVVKNFSEFTFSDWFGEKKQREFLVQSNVSNSGNVSIEHENNVIVSNLLSSKEPQIIGRKFQVLKKDKFISNMPWSKPLLGYYAFQAQVKYQNSAGDEDILLSQPVKILIMPWRELTLLVILLGILWGAYIAWRYYQKKKYGGIGWVEYNVKKTDTIAKLATKYAIDWKVLVRSNKIKPPFLLEAGMLILVPFAEEGRKVAAKKDVVAETKTAVKTRASVKKVKEVVLIAPVQKIFKKKYMLWVAAILLFVVIIAAADVMIGRSKSASIDTILSISSLSGPTEVKSQALPVETTASSVAKVADAPAKKDAGDVIILNGGAAAGTAGRIAEFLKGKGFDQVATKNAELDTHAGVVVYYQDEYEPFAKKIMDSLNEKYKDAKLQIAQDDEQKSAAVVIVLGK